MKKIKFSKRLLILLAAVVLMAAGVLTFRMIRINRSRTMVQQQNYVASKLLELGDYEQGRQLAAQSEQMLENMISKELLVLAAGFQFDLDSAQRYLEAYLAKEADSVMQQAQEIFTEFITQEQALIDREEADYLTEYDNLKADARMDLLTLLLTVQEAIPVKKTGEDIQSMLRLMSSQGAGLGREDVERLESDTSPLSQKVQVAYAIQTGDYTEAFEKAEKLFAEDDSFENRAMLANLVAKQGNYLWAQNQTIQELMEKQHQLQAQLNELSQQYNETASATEQLKLQQKLEGVQSELTQVQQEMDAEPAKKAINFIETTTPIMERDTVAYKIELSQLYYQANEKEKAKDILWEVLKEDETDMEPAAFLVKDFITKYLSIGESLDAGYQQEDNSLQTVWSRISGLLNFVDDPYSYGNADSYYGFVLNTLDEIYNGLIIRQIDATDFPTVRVMVNVAMETEERLQKKDFALEEMGASLQSFELLNLEEEQEGSAMAVELVVDRSGSMGGDPMLDTKKAVSNFVKNVEEDIRTGLVAFDGTAEVIAPVSQDKSGVLRGIESIEADGGTSIASGLKTAGEVLALESGRRIIILISDGEDGDEPMIDTVLEELNRQNIYVYTIGFGGADTEYLSYIANKCGGKFIQADSSKVLTEIYAAIGQYMTNDYLLEFTVETAPEDFTRNLKVTVDANDSFDEEEYSVGVPYEKIEEEQDEKPLADYFRQIGGSQMDAEQQEEG